MHQPLDEWKDKWSGHILVAGAAGFIESHLIDKLLALGLRFTGLDNPWQIARAQ